MLGKFQVLSLVLIPSFAGRVDAQVANPAPIPELAYEGRLTESDTLVTDTRSFVFSILRRYQLLGVRLGSVKAEWVADIHGCRLRNVAGYEPL